MFSFDSGVRNRTVNSYVRKWGCYRFHFLHEADLRAVSSAEHSSVFGMNVVLLSALKKAAFLEEQTTCVLGFAQQHF